MAIFRADNNKKAFEAVPSELIKKNEQTGEVMFAYDKFIVGGSADGAITVANGDVILACELPAFAKPLRVTIKASASLGENGVVNVGHSNSAQLNDKDNTVVADHDAYIVGWDPEVNLNATMPVTAVGYLAENTKPTFVVVEFATIPDALAGQTVEVIVEYVAK